MPERIHESQATISESSHVQWSFIQLKAHLCLWSCSLDNTLNRPSSAWESFKIRQKLDLFVLGVTHISNLPTVCVKWCEWVGGSSTLVIRFDTWNIDFCLKSYLVLKKILAWIMANLKAYLIMPKSKNLNWLHNVTLKILSLQIPHGTVSGA